MEQATIEQIKAQVQVVRARSGDLLTCAEEHIKTKEGIGHFASHMAAMRKEFIKLDDMTRSYRLEQSFQDD